MAALGVPLPRTTAEAYGVRLLTCSPAPSSRGMRFVRDRDTSLEGDGTHQDQDYDGGLQWQTTTGSIPSPTDGPTVARWPPPQDTSARRLRVRTYGGDNGKGRYRDETSFATEGVHAREVAEGLVAVGHLLGGHDEPLVGALDMVAPGIVLVARGEERSLK